MNEAWDAGYLVGMRQSHDRPSVPLAASSKMPPQRGGPSVPAAAGLPICPGTGGDPLSDVLRTVKLTGALFFLVDASSPWGVEVPPAGVFSPIILPRAQHVVSYRRAGGVRLGGNTQRDVHAVRGG